MLDADEDLRDLLSDPQAAAFARWLDVASAPPDLGTLRGLLQAYLGRVPFQNVTMLARPRRAPTLEEIRADVLAGRGGPCGVMNPFFAALLHRLGFTVCLLRGSMQQPDCHIAVGVLLEGRHHWLDVGNGHPYLDVIPLGDEAPRTHGGLTYRVRPLEDGARYAVEHRLAPAAPWRCSYTFLWEPTAFFRFAAMIEHHYTTVGYGPFLSGLRVIRCPGGALRALRDRELILSAGEYTVREPVPDRAALRALLARHFGDLDLPFSEALDALRALGSPLFSAGEEVP